MSRNGDVTMTLAASESSHKFAIGWDLEIRVSCEAGDTLVTRAALTAVKLSRRPLETSAYSPNYVDRFYFI